MSKDKPKPDKSKSSAQRKELPLDSPNWISLVEEAYRLLRARLGSSGLAAKELYDAVRDPRDHRRVPTMRRCFLHYKGRLVGPEHELLDLAHWDDHRLVGSDNSLEVIEGPLRSDVRPLICVAVKGFAYFVWKPALAKLWPDVFAPATMTMTATTAAVEASDHKRGSRKRGSLIRKAIRDEADNEYGRDGWKDVPTVDIIKAVSPRLKARRIRIPHRSTWEHALGRRKD